MWADEQWRGCFLERILGCCRSTAKHAGLKVMGKQCGNTQRCVCGAAGRSMQAWKWVGLEVDGKHGSIACGCAEVFVWGRGEYGRLGLGDRSGSSKLRATPVHFREPDIRIVQVLTFTPCYVLFTFSAPLPARHHFRVVRSPPGGLQALKCLPDELHRFLAAAEPCQFLMDRPALKA